MAPSVTTGGSGGTGKDQPTTGGGGAQSGQEQQTTNIMGAPPLTRIMQDAGEYVRNTISSGISNILNDDGSGTIEQLNTQKTALEQEQKDWGIDHNDEINRINTRIQRIQDYQEYQTNVAEERRRWQTTETINQMKENLRLQKEQEANADKAIKQVKSAKPGSEVILDNVRMRYGPGGQNQQVKIRKSNTNPPKFRLYVNDLLIDEKSQSELEDFLKTERALSFR